MAVKRSKRKSAPKKRKRADFYRISEKLFKATEAAAKKKLDEKCVEWALRRYSDNVWRNLPIFLGAQKSLFNETLKCCRKVGKEAAQKSVGKQQIAKSPFVAACKAQEALMRGHGLVCK